MSRRSEGRGESILSILIGILVLLAGAAAVFYAAYKVSYVSVDYGIHVGIAEELDWSDPVQMLKEHPEPVWHILVRIAMKICRVDAQRAAGFVSGGLCALTYLIAAHFLYRAVGKGAITARDTAVNLSVKASAAASPGSASGLSLIGAAVFTWLLSISSAIFVPWFNEKPYVGQGSPNPWVNVCAFRGAVSARDRDCVSGRDSCLPFFCCSPTSPNPALCRFFIRPSSS